MESSTRLSWSWANVLTKRRYDALIEGFGSLDCALSKIDSALLRGLGCREETVDGIERRLKDFHPHVYVEQLKALGITLLSIEDAEYPPQLLTIDDPPIFLYCQGSVDVLRYPCVALVGTRNMSSYGKRVTAEVVTGLVAAQVTTVSGLAYGIDSEVARQTLAAGGRTVAVLGHGLGTMYPKANRALADAILAAGGLLVSEFPLDTRPDKYTFPARNRIIAGLSLATVVLEAAKDSGSLITADLALDYNRQVFAVPGQMFDAHYAGCHELIASSRATLLTAASDILHDVGIVALDRAAPDVISFDSAGQEQLWRRLTTMPQSLDDLLDVLDLPASTVVSLLTIFEMRGLATNVGQGKWVRG